MKSWYLINPPSTNSGGFEDESFNDYRYDAISDILGTELASDIVIYKSDLSEDTSVNVRAVVQNNTAATYLNAMQREFISTPGTFTSGDYVYFEGEYWLIVGRPGTNKVYEKVVTLLCQYKLKWQKDDGSVVERWANFTSASKYDKGEAGNYVLYLTTNNYTILMPQDKDSETIDGRRVFVDLSDEPRKVFRITRDDDVLLNYPAHGGIFTFIASKDEFDPHKDNPELGLCDYFEPFVPEITEDDPPIVTIDITCKGEKMVVAGGNPKTFTANFYSSDGQDVDERSMTWTVTCTPENEKYVHYEVVDIQKIRLQVDYDTSIIGTSIMLTAKCYNDSESIYVEIGGGI